MAQRAAFFLTKELEPWSRRSTSGLRSRAISALRANTLCQARCAQCCIRWLTYHKYSPLTVALAQQLPGRDSGPRTRRCCRGR